MAALERLGELDQEIKQLITFAEPAIKKGRRALLGAGRALEDAGLYTQQLANMRSRIHAIQQAAGELVKEVTG